MKRNISIVLIILVTLLLSIVINKIIDLFWEQRYAPLEEVILLKEEMRLSRDSFSRENAKTYQLYLSIDKRDKYYQHTVDSMKSVIEHNTQNIEKQIKNYETPANYNDSAWHVIIGVLDSTGTTLFND